MPDRGVFALLTTGLLITACSSVPTPPATDTDVRMESDTIDTHLTVRADFPAKVLPELKAWYDALPPSFLEGVKHADVIFLAKDGHVYSTNTQLLTRQGNIVPDGQGGTFVQFQDGSAGPTFPSDSWHPGVAALSTNYPSCTPARDGPFWRSWSGTGYGAIYSILNINTVVFPAPVGSRPWAAYQYMGGQANNRATEVDAGLVYYSSQLRVFYNVNGTYREAQSVDPNFTVSAGVSYPTRINVNGQDTLIMRVDRSGGASSILLNLPSAPGFNSAGTDQYWKRMVTIANGDLVNVFPNGYDGSVKYNAINGASYTDSKLGTFSGSTINYASWSASSISSFGCAVTGTAVTTTSGSSQTDNVNVKIDMSR